MRRSMWVCAVALAFGLAGCNDSATGNGNGNPTESDVVVLNSLSKTIQQFNVIDGQLVPYGQAISLPANYDGVSIDVLEQVYVTTTSAFGGSQIIFGSVETGERSITTFPGADAGLADAGRATLILDTSGTLGALVPARARDLIYAAFPGQATAQIFTDEAGTFVERAIPFDVFVLAIDANLDDDGGTYQSLGPPRVAYMSARNGSYLEEVGLTGAVGSTDAVTRQQKLFVLAGGGFDATTFDPAGDGSVVAVNLQGRGVESNDPLGGNGISIEAGRDGLGYIVRTKGAGTYETDIVTYNFSIGHFERGPTDPIQPTDAAGAAIDCWVASALADGRLLCATFEASSQGRLYLLDSEGAYMHDVAIGAGAADIFLR